MAAPRALKLAGSLLHAGRVYEAGDPVPDGVDLDRLKRLGLIAAGKPETAGPDGK
jgi:hypothetical protein